MAVETSGEETLSPIRNAGVVPLWRRLLSRFAFTYLLLFCGSVLTQVFDFEWFNATVGKAWTLLGLLVGKLLGLGDIATATTGSGDRTIDYLILLAIAVLSVVGAVVWSRFDVHGHHDARVRAFVRIAVRYTVGLLMLSYGLAKMTEDGQFPPPSIGRLTQRYGDSSPMGLLWTFMGASQAYVKFSGIAEILGGGLLLFRRTTLAGALVTIGVMTNVTMLNFCYDVPVKINATHYLVMAMWLAAPDARRLVDVVLLHRAVAAPPPIPVLRLRGRRWPVLVGKLAIVIAFVVPIYSYLTARGDSRTTWFDGWWQVESFTRNGTDVPAIIDDKTRWLRMKLETGPDRKYMRWHNVDGSSGDLFLVVEDTDRQLVFETVGKEPAVRYTFALSRPAEGQFRLVGKLDADELDVTFKRFVADDMRLVKRGFHWINEVPFSR
jgi:hypothetical protein